LSNQRLALDSEGARQLLQQRGRQQQRRFGILGRQGRGLRVAAVVEVRCQALVQKVLFDASAEVFGTAGGLRRPGGCRAAPLAGDGAPLRRPALMELQAIEDPDWPPHRRFLGALAREEVCLRFDDDAAQALEMNRCTAALSEPRGNLRSLPWGNPVLAELMAGDAVAAVQTGQARLSSLRGSRDERGQACVRVNLAVALLVLDRTAEARSVAVDGWPQVGRYDLLYDWADQLALLAALESRPVEAMQLVGFADAGFSRIEEVCSPTSAAAVERALAIAIQTLGAAEAALWRMLGRDMPAGVIARLARIEPVDH
jgi:hypothetical protein